MNTCIIHWKKDPSLKNCEFPLKSWDLSLKPWEFSLKAVLVHLNSGTLRIFVTYNL